MRADELRLDVHNGLLLSALWDCAFGSGLVGFSDGDGVLRSPWLSEAAARALHLETVSTLNGLTGAHRGPLVRHGAKHFLNPTD